MSDEEKKRFLEASLNGLVALVASNFSLSTFVCPGCGLKIMVSKDSTPFCLKCFKVMDKSNG